MKTQTNQESCHRLGALVLKQEEFRTAKLRIALKPDEFEVFCQLLNEPPIVPPKQISLR
jgi:hypothetical protein